MAIINFLARPNQVTLNQLTLLESSFTDNDGTVVYQISDASPITFVGGMRKIESDITGMENSTATALEGPTGGVRISAYRKGNPNDKISRLVRII